MKATTKICESVTLYRVVPTMSSRYSSKPHSFSVAPFGFIIAIDSTSPYIGQSKTLYFIEFIHIRICDTHLQNQKTIVIQIDIMLFQHFGHFFEMDSLTVDVVVGTIVSECRTRDSKSRIRYKVIGTIWLVDNLREMNGNFA